jgi:glutamate-ammonia-ligase adenylyltransferase
MDPVRADRTATEILRTLTGIPGQGGMYDVDIRLRPEGKNAPPVTDAESLNRYLLKRASLWERQSFTRLRFICGDAGIGREVLQTVADWVYGSPLSAGWIRAVVEMRRRMEPRSQFRNEAPINLKRSSGGMVDVEFISQILQLNAGQAARRLQGSSVAQILAAPEFREVLAATERDVLIVSYLRYREIEKMMRVCLDERSSVIPEGEKLERLARCLDGTAAGEFQHRLGEDLKRIRRMFQAISERLGTAAS